MTKQNVIDLLARLRNLRGAVSKGAYEGGICAIVPGELTPLLTNKFRLWPEFSGNVAYPIPDPLGGLIAFVKHYESLWDENTEYGKARRRLLDFLIEEFEKDLKEMGDE